MYKTFFKYLAAGVLSAAFFSAHGQSSAPISAGQYSLTIPNQWEIKQNFMGADVIATPDRTKDKTGWENDLLIVSRQPVKQSMTVKQLVADKMKQMGHHSTSFKLMAQENLNVAGKKAILSEIQYNEGPRVLQSFVLVLPAEQKKYLSAVLSSSPERFTQYKDHFKQIIQNLVSAQPSTK